MMMSIRLAAPGKETSEPSDAFVPHVEPEDDRVVRRPNGDLNLAALGALITERRDGLRLAEQALASLAEEHRATTSGRELSDLIEVVTGVDAIRHRYQQVQQAAASELRMFVTTPFVAVPIGQKEDAAAREKQRFDERWLSLRSFQAELQRRQ